MEGIPHLVQPFYKSIKGWDKAYINPFTVSWKRDLKSIKKTLLDLCILVGRFEEILVLAVIPNNGTIKLSIF